MNFEKVFNKEFLYTVIACSYFFGFILWNRYLGSYGFFEINVLQTRFISAGLIFILPVTLLFLFVNKEGKDFFTIKFTVWFILYFFGYSLLLFQHIPQAYGGAKPFPVSILGSQEQIIYLNMFNLASAKDSTTQTVPVCELYSDGEKMIIGVSTIDGLKITSQRVMILNKNETKGFQPMAPMEAENIRKDIDNILS